MAKPKVIVLPDPVPSGQRKVKVPVLIIRPDPKAKVPKPKSGSTLT